MTVITVAIGKLLLALDNNLVVIMTFEAVAEWNNLQMLADWNEWSPWSFCSATCGDGTITRSRSCVSGNDRECVGEPTEQSSCNLTKCPSNIR